VWRAVKNAIQKTTCEIQAFALGFIIYSALFLAHVGSFGACTDCTTSLASPMPASSLVSPRILKKLTANLRKQLLECAVETVCRNIISRSSGGGGEFQLLANVEIPADDTLISQVFA